MMSRPGQEEKQKITGLRRVTNPPWDRLLRTARWNDYTVLACSSDRLRQEEKLRPASLSKGLRRKTAEQTK